MWEGSESGLDREIRTVPISGLAVNRDNVPKVGPTSGREHQWQVTIICCRARTPQPYTLSLFSQRSQTIRRIILGSR